MAINGRNKGSAGEREAAKWMQKLLSLDYTPERNLEQVRSGGYDLYVHPFMVEVKRCERLEYRKWWRQVTDAAKGYECIPVVLFRQNRQPWRLLISATYIGLSRGFILLDHTETKQWLRNKYETSC